MSQTLHKFSGEVSQGLCKARRRFVEEMIYGIQARGSARIKEDTLLIVDPSDLTKKYAKKMEYLAEVRDGSEEKIGMRRRL